MSLEKHYRLIIWIPPWKAWFVQTFGSSHYSIRFSVLDVYLINKWRFGWCINVHFSKINKFILGKSVDLFLKCMLGKFKNAHLHGINRCLVRCRSSFTLDICTPQNWFEKKIIQKNLIALRQLFNWLQLLNILFHLSSCYIYCFFYPRNMVILSV